ncbi:hypothetical protein FJW05_01580 [Mesorhizobium sp. B2-9-1]|nr:hypothetical protein FJW05_01580 [Mesorhizobium sp. B2-9-1]
MSKAALSGSAFVGIAELLKMFVSAQFRTENRYALFLELLHGGAAARPAGIVAARGGPICGSDRSARG